MKKLLIGTTALVAVGVAAPAMAAEPIKLGVGGFMHQWVGYATNNGAQRDRGTASAGDDRQYVKFDSKSAGELWFSGSTKLDNGLTVKAVWEVEAEAGAASSIDMMYVDVTSPTLGQLTVGKLLPTNFLARHVATHYGIGYNGSDGGGTPTAWVLPSSGTAAASPVRWVPVTTSMGSANKDQMISYWTPRWEGLGAAFSYIPNAGTTTATTVGGMQYSSSQSGTAGAGHHQKAWTGNLVYDNTIAGWTLGGNLGYWSTSGGAANADFTSWNYGLSVGYAGFTLAHSLVRTSMEKAAGGTANAATASAAGVGPLQGSLDGTSYDIGLAYTNGPWGVAYFFQRNQAEGNTTVAADDKVDYHHLSAKYNLGPGVDLKSSLFHIKYKDENTATTNSNSGWGLVAGMALSF